MKRTLSFITISAFLVLGACSDDDAAPQKDGGPTADTGGATSDSASNTSAVGFKVLDVYDGVQGTASIEVSVEGTPAKVELFVDGTPVAEATSAPYTISWDTTTVADGVVKLQLKTDGDASSIELPVVVINSGKAVEFIAPAEGSVNIPADVPYLEEHHKFHWIMPPYHKNIISALIFDDPNFLLSMDVGVGSCPDSGTTAATVESKDSPIEVTFGDGANSLAETQWFAHVGMRNPTDEAVKGKSCNFKIKTYIFE